MMDEDVFLDEVILAEDEAALLMVQRDEALASRLSRWKRPALPAGLVAGCSQSVGNFDAGWSSAIWAFEAILSC
jgi:DNA polymerase delta subunit 1